jgi:serine/threonine protein phosphatase 1
MIYAIGDIHGCLDQLLRLLDLVAGDAAARGVARPRVVFLGDYIDRGPDSKGVLDLLSSGSLGARFEPVYLLGNHDMALMSILRGGDPSADWIEEEGGWATMQSYGDFRARGPKQAAKRFRAAVPEAHKAFLADLEISWRADGLFFSHAGYSPRFALDEQPYGALVYGDPAMLSDGRPKGAEEARARLGARVVHGHWRDREAVVLAHRVCVDTGAGYATGRLSAAAIDVDDVRVLGA